MIDRQEIIERAGELSLRPEVVEKDYALGWVLAGISQDAEIGGSWIFKGGTCLKKVYFETYRFSEDLDFTLADATQLDEAFLRRVFTEIADWIYEQTGIEIPAEQLRFELYSNQRGKASVQGRLYYRGPLTPRGSLPGIRLDLTADERIVQPPVLEEIDHPYSDAPAGGIYTRCYPYMEVFAEKIRALGDRGSPRDLYDVINLFRRDDAREQAVDVYETLREKCDFKSLEVPSLSSLNAHRTDLEADWANMLGSSASRASALRILLERAAGVLRLAREPSDSARPRGAPTRNRRGPATTRRWLPRTRAVRAAPRNDPFCRRESSLRRHRLPR